MADDDDLIEEELPADGWEIAAGDPDVIDFKSNPRELGRRLWWCIYQAEQALELPGPAHGSLTERLDRILRRALAGRLDPVLYQVCYALRRAPVPR
jgi:hypothetical protein